MSIQASGSIEALVIGLKKINWESINAGTEILLRDDEYHQKTGQHGIVFSLHAGFDPLRDEVSNDMDE